MFRSLFVALPIVCGVLIAPAYAQTLAMSDWSGAYVGASLGLANNISDTKASTTIGGATSYFTTPDDVQIAGAGKGSFSQSRLSGGIFGGTQKLYGPVLVGIESSLNSLSFDEARSKTITYTSFPAAQFTLRQAATADWQGTLRLRLGYVQKSWITYVTGGAAVAQVKVKTSFSDNAIIGASGLGANTETKFGWTVGFGGEYAINKSWAIRGEYLYSDFGRVDTNTVVTNPAYPALLSTLSGSVKFKTQVLSIGLVYRF